MITYKIRYTIRQKTEALGVRLGSFIINNVVLFNSIIIIKYYYLKNFRAETRSKKNTLTRQYSSLEKENY